MKFLDDEQLKSRSKKRKCDDADVIDDNVRTSNTPKRTIPPRKMAKLTKKSKNVVDKSQLSIKQFFYRKFPAKKQNNSSI